MQISVEEMQEIIRDDMKARGLNQQQLADEIFGVHQPDISTALNDCPNYAVAEHYGFARKKIVVFEKIDE